MSKRFDHRTKDTFKKDIKFGTSMEAYWWEKLISYADDSPFLTIDNWEDNGCGNDGEFIASGNTAGADYLADMHYRDRYCEELPIEIKWVPTAGKFTLKEADLKAYVAEGASILFIYNSVRCGNDLRKPKDHDFEKHIKKIESLMHNIKWGVMMPEKVKEFYENAKDNNLFTPIFYMGGKQGIVLQQRDFDQWFKQESWNYDS